MILSGRFCSVLDYIIFHPIQVCASYPVAWKRKAFFEFVKLWNMPESAHAPVALSQELKAKILQYVIIPCFSAR